MSTALCGGAGPCRTVRASGHREPQCREFPNRIVRKGSYKNAGPPVDRSNQLGLSSRDSRDDHVTSAAVVEHLRTQHGMVLVVASHVSVLVRADRSKQVGRPQLVVAVLGVGL